jgi:hypothetical protein
VNEGVGGEDDGAAKLVGLAGEVSDFAAGFLDKEHPGGGVPLFEAEFPEAVEAACGHKGQVERGGAIAAHAVRTHGEIAVILEIGSAFAIVYGKTGAEQAGAEGGVLRDMDFFAVERGAFAAGGSEEFFGNGIVNDGGEEGIALGEAEGDAETGVAMGEVGGAVEGIDVPAEFGGGFVAGAFFGGDGMVGEMFGDAGDDGLLGALVGLRNEVDLVPFVRDLRRPGKLFAEDLAGFPGDFDGGFEIVFGHGKIIPIDRKSADKPTSGSSGKPSAGTSPAPTPPKTRRAFVCKDLLHFTINGGPPPPPGVFGKEFGIA